MLFDIEYALHVIDIHTNILVKELILTSDLSGMDTCVSVYYAYTQNCYCELSCCFAFTVCLVLQRGFTVLFIASERGDLQVVKMLIEAKADVNIKAKVGALASRDT